MRKIKEGYRLSYSYKNDLGRASYLFTYTKDGMQACLDNNMERDSDGDPIIDYQFFDPDGHKCTLEEATEKKELVIQEGTYWRHNISGKVVMVILDRSKLTKFNPGSRLRYLAIFDNGISTGYELEHFENFTQVKNWEGDPL